MKTVSILAVMTMAATVFSGVLHAGTTGAAFLKISPGARAAGLGSACTALTGDVNALHGNPAGTAGLGSRQVTGMHARWLSDMTLDSAGAAVPTENGTFGIGVVRLSQGDLEGRDENREATDTFGAGDLSVTLNYGARITPSVDGGINLKYIRQEIASYAANGVAFDAGLQFSPVSHMPLRLGFAVQNAGPGMKFINEAYALPLTYAAGVSYRALGVLSLAMDVRYQPGENRTDVAFGTEYSVLDMLQLRAGCLLGPSLGMGGEDSLNLPSGAGAGVGFLLFGNRLDYAFAPYGSLGATHRVSLTFDF